MEKDGIVFSLILLPPTKLYRRAPLLTKFKKFPYAKLNSTYRKIKKNKNKSEKSEDLRQHKRPAITSIQVAVKVL